VYMPPNGCRVLLVLYSCAIAEKNEYLLEK
jgi:hypothetical protein